MNNPSRPTWAIRIITVLVILPFVPSAYFKLVHAPQAVEGIGKACIPESALTPIGLVELACLALYLIPRTVVLGTFLLTGYLGGAVVTNIAMRSDFLHALVIGLLVWAGAWLRVPELRVLWPLRRMP